MYVEAIRNRFANSGAPNVRVTLSPLAVALSGSGVGVTIVAPDFVLSQIHRRALGPDGAPLGKSPMQESHIMTADECAALYFFMNISPYGRPLDAPAA